MHPVSDIAMLKPYRARRSSSYDRTGGNFDATGIAPGESLTILDVAGAGEIVHIWFTISCRDLNYLRRVTVRGNWGQSPVNVRCPRWRSRHGST